MRVRCCEQGCCVCGCRCIYSDRMPLLRASRHLSAVRSKVGSGSIDRRMTDLPAWLNSRQDTASFTKAERERERLRSGGSGYRARMSSKQASDREREREREQNSTIQSTLSRATKINHFPHTVKQTFLCDVKPINPILSQCHSVSDIIRPFIDFGRGSLVNIYP